MVDSKEKVSERKGSKAQRMALQKCGRVGKGMVAQCQR